MTFYDIVSKFMISAENIWLMVLQAVFSEEIYVSNFFNHKIQRVALAFTDQVGFAPKHILFPPPADDQVSDIGIHCDVKKAKNVYTEKSDGSFVVPKLGRISMRELQDLTMSLEDTNGEKEKPAKEINGTEAKLIMHQVRQFIIESLPRVDEAHAISFKLGYNFFQHLASFEPFRIKLMKLSGMQRKDLMKYLI